jgi:hypothetical protein
MIVFNSDLTSGTMMQSTKRGDFVVNFTGVYDETGFRAVIGEIVSRPPGIPSVPESFTLWFHDEGKNATYQCLTGGGLLI